ncbi:MAG TPA: AI-2E family transporter [Solirubrobacteraceae bacterium]|nr:AI-2E family transporter [Solirubrobacteraceae bacterium]
MSTNAARSPLAPSAARGSEDPSRTTPAATVRIASPSLRGVLRILLIVIASAIALYLIWRVRTVVRLVAISVFLALVIYPVVDAVDRRTRAHRALVILAIYLFLITAIAVIGYVVVPSMVTEISTLARDAPRYAHDLRADSTFRHYDNRYHITAKLVDDARHLPERLAHLVGPLKDVTVSAAGFFGQLVTVLVLTFLLALHGRDYVEYALSLSGEHEAHYRELVVKVNRAVAGYMLGNILISALATIVTWVVLSILGVPYAIALGFVMGFFDLIPLVGATLGSIAVALATVTVDFPVATIVWIVSIFLWQRFEDYVIQPLVYNRMLRVNPIVTIVAVLAGASLLGVLGALIAIPTAAAIQIILSDWWSTRRAARSLQHEPDHRPGSSAQPTD